MKTKVVIPREQAARDIDQALDHYLTTAGEVVASAFVDALVCAVQCRRRAAALAGTPFARR